MHRGIKCFRRRNRENKKYLSIKQIEAGNINKENKRKIKTKK